MKRSLVPLAMLALAGCSEPLPPEIWHDPVTGCDYLIVHTPRSADVTPRMWSDGKQVCTEKQSNTP